MAMEINVQMKTSRNAGRVVGRWLAEDMVEEKGRMRTYGHMSDVGRWKETTDLKGVNNDARNARSSCWGGGACIGFRADVPEPLRDRSTSLSRPGRGNTAGNILQSAQDNVLLLKAERLPQTGVRRGGLVLAWGKGIFIPIFSQAILRYRGIPGGSVEQDGFESFHW